jgi:DNA invertase Pin-like site-specific DNA recombinase
MHNNNINYINSINVYIRVSTSKQASDDSNGLDIQLNACQQHCLKNYGKSKKVKANIFQDIGSSYNYKNTLKERNKLLKKLPEESTIIIYDISRIGRNTIETMDFLKKVRQKKSIIYSVNDELYFNKCKLMDKNFYHKVIDSEKSSDLKSIASKKRIQIIKKNGGVIGRIPFGYHCIKEDGIRKLKKNYHENHTISLIKKKMISFSKTCSNPYTKTSEYLNDNDITYRDKLWTARLIKYIVTADNNNLCRRLNNIHI